MKVIKGALITVCLILVPALLHAQVLRVQASVSSDSMMIGDQAEFRIRVEAREGVAFRLPPIADTLSAEIEVLTPVRTDTVRSEERVTVDHIYRITSFEAGMQQIPPQPVIYSFDGLTDTALSRPLFVSVFEPAVDTSAQIMPIKPPINTPVTLREALPWIGLGLAVWMVASLVYALVWMYRQRKRDPDIFTIRPLEPAHVVAFRELDGLREEKLWEKGMVKEFYTRLTGITRQYIERQYGIPAMERTTREILDAFRRSNPDDPILDEMLRELLELADMVKFAREEPLPVDNQTNLNNAYLFVQKTYPLFLAVNTEENMPAEAGQPGEAAEKEEVHG